MEAQVKALVEAAKETVEHTIYPGWKIADSLDRLRSALKPFEEGEDNAP